MPKATHLMCVEQSSLVGTDLVGTAMTSQGTSSPSPQWEYIQPLTRLWGWASDVTFLYLCFLNCEVSRH